MADPVNNKLLQISQLIITITLLKHTLSNLTMFWVKGRGGGGIILTSYTKEQYF